MREAIYQRHAGANIELCAPAARNVRVRLASSSDSWNTDIGDRPVMNRVRSASLSAGLGISSLVSPLGRVGLVGMAGWDNGPGGAGALELRSRHYDLDLSAWSTNAREARVVLPADSLRDLGVTQSVRGGEIRLGAMVPVGGVEVRPAVEWRRELFTGGTSESSGFLAAPAHGSQTVLRAGATVWVEGWSAGADYRERTVDLAAPVLRTDASAGLVRRAPMSLSGWRAAMSGLLGSRRWSVQGGSDQMDSEVSARIETWPFVSLWESLSAQAYRFNGALSGRSAWIRLMSSPIDSTGWEWSVEVGRYRVQVDRDSWYVTNLGFGRSERIQTTDGADPSILVGGDVERRWSTSLGTLGGRITGGIPVHTKSLAGGAPPSGEGLAGYASFRLEWVS